MEKIMQDVTYNHNTLTSKRCFRCKNFVHKEVDEDLKTKYPYYCPECDENMFEMEVNEDEMRRDTWIVINELTTAIRNLNALFCERDDNPMDTQICTQAGIDQIAVKVAINCSPMMIADALTILERAEKLGE
jgi:NAD-dependent SIR2 family protein deacetylase